MNQAPPNGSVTAPSRASQADPLSNGSAVPYRDDQSSHDPSRPPQYSTGGFPSPAPQRQTSSQPDRWRTDPVAGGNTSHKKNDSDIIDPNSFEDWDDGDDLDEDDPFAPKPGSMPSDLRPPFHRPTDGKSGTPLLNSSQKENGYAGGQIGDSSPPLIRRRSTFKERDPDVAAKSATRKRYSYAAFFLAVSLVSFAVQTETAVYIKKYLGWSKSYAML